MPQKSLFSKFFWKEIRNQRILAKIKHKMPLQYGLYNLRQAEDEKKCRNFGVS